MGKMGSFDKPPQMPQDTWDVSVAERTALAALGEGRVAAPVVKVEVDKVPYASASDVGGTAIEGAVSTFETMP